MFEDRLDNCLICCKPRGDFYAWRRPRLRDYMRLEAVA
jgi:hypothetical protein